jgi:hypothetical protein
VDEAVCSQFQSKPQTGEDAAALVHGEILEVYHKNWGSPLMKEMWHACSLMHWKEHCIMENINHALQIHYLGWVGSIGWMAGKRWCGPHCEDFEGMQLHRLKRAMP